MHKSGMAVWLGSHVEPELVEHVDRLASQLGTTRSHVIRTVLRHTDIERVLGDLRREAGTSVDRKASEGV